MIITGNEPKIMIVDDDPTSCSILNGYLRTDNYQLYCVDNGKEALKLADKIKPDLIILDIIMPGISGFEVCNILKKNETTQNIPVLFISALSDDDSHKRGIEAGGEGFLVKPFFNEDLIRAYVKTFLNTKKAFDEVGQRLALNKDFTSMTIHDLNNLNTVVAGNLELAMMIFDEHASARKYVEKAFSAVIRVNEMLKNAQDIASFKTTCDNKSFNFVNLIDLIKMALALFETEMESKNLKFDLQAESDFVEIYGDSNLLQRVLANLIDNAVKFSWADTKISLAVIKKKKEGGDSIDRAEVIISNMCSPVQKEYHELIFEKFKQVPGEQDKKRGKGLGLALCKMVIEVHGGRIWMESPLPGEESGAAIHFTLPCLFEKNQTG